VPGLADGQDGAGSAQLFRFEQQQIQELTPPLPAVRARSRSSARSRALLVSAAARSNSLARLGGASELHQQVAAHARQQWYFSSAGSDSSASTRFRPTCGPDAIETPPRD
jgi:hypothetical protein